MAGAEGGGQAEAVALAKKTLAATLPVSAEAFQLDKVEAVDWPDASLGCPEKEMMYAQVLTSGYRVVLRAGDARHEVHVGGGRAVVCGGADRAMGLPSRSEGSFSSPLLAASAAQAYGHARKALSTRLKLPEDAIKVISVRPSSRSDAGGQDCPEADSSEATSVKAFLVELEAQGKTYAYVADATSARPCEQRRQSKPPK